MGDKNKAGIKLWEWSIGILDKLITSYILSILPVVTGTIITMLIDLNYNIYLWMLWGTILLSTVFFVVFTVYYIHKKSYRNDLKWGYIMQKTRLELNYISREKIEYFVTNNIKIVQENLGEIKPKYTWTGSSVDKIELYYCSNNEFKIIKPKKGKSVLDYSYPLDSEYMIKHDETMIKGKGYEYCVKMQGYDNERKCSPYLNTIVGRPTERLELRVNFDCSVKVENGYYKIERRFGEQKQVDKRKLKLEYDEQNDQYYFEKKFPRTFLFNAYTIEWEFR